MRDRRRHDRLLADFSSAPACFVSERPTAQPVYVDGETDQKLAMCWDCRELAARAGLIGTDVAISIERALAARFAFGPREPGGEWLRAWRGRSR